MTRNHVIATILADCEYHEKLIKSLEDELRNLPEGSIYHRLIRNISRFYYYSPSGKRQIPSSQRYIKKEEQPLIEDLLRKKFILMCLMILRPNLSALKMLLKIYKLFDPDQIMREICKDFNLKGDGVSLSIVKKKNPNAWENEQYEKSSLYPEKLEYTTQNGLRVRSKSESIIAGLLEINQIPFRYEALLSVGEHNFYTDFTILNPQDNTIIYWEHFGMVDNEEYELTMNRKLKVYKDNGISQWDNLIVTYETKANPFNAQKIQKLIKALLLA